MTCNYTNKLPSEAIEGVVADESFTNCLGMGEVVWGGHTPLCQRSIGASAWIPLVPVPGYTPAAGVHTEYGVLVWEQFCLNLGACGSPGEKL